MGGPISIPRYAPSCDKSFVRCKCVTDGVPYNVSDDNSVFFADSDCHTECKRICDFFSVVNRNVFAGSQQFAECKLVVDSEHDIDAQRHTVFIADRVWDAVIFRIFASKSIEQ